MANAKRVLLLVTSADWGGVQAFVVRFGTYLKSHGVEVLLAAGGEGRLWDEAAKAGIPTRRLTRMRRELSPWFDMAAVHEIRVLIEEFKPDAVHLNSSKMGVVGSLAASLSTHRPRTVYRIGGWVFLEPLPSWKRWMYRFAEKFTAGYKDVIITVHPGDEAVARRLGIKPLEDIVTVPNGLPEDFASHLLSRDEARQALGILKDAFVFGTVANAYPPKALPAYVRLLDGLLPQIDARAVIVGGGPGLTELKDLVETLPSRKRILLTGERADAGHLYRAFDAFVLPSEKEGMPWALLEAMAAGLPCIATDVGACRWMLTLDGKRAGDIVPVKDPEALVAAMTHLKEDGGRRVAMGQDGAWLASHAFTWDKTARGNRAALDGKTT